jgi:hypothetical protein
MSTKSSSLYYLDQALQHRASMILTSHRTEYLCSSLDPSSLHFSTKLQQLALSFSISLQSCTENLQYTSDHTDLVTSTKPLAIHHIDVLLLLLTLPKYLFIDYKMGLSMGKPTRPTSLSHYINPKTLKWSQKWVLLH